MVCPNCHYDALPDGAKFCPNCGVKTTGADAPTRVLDVDVTVGKVEGGKVVGAEIANFEAHFERGEVIEQQNIYNIAMELGSEQGKQFLDGIASRLVVQLGLDKMRADQLSSSAAPAVASEQIRHVIYAQKEAAARGISASAGTAHHLGQLAAFRRDYEEALTYFRQAAQADPNFMPAWESIMWLQQSRAMQDIQRQEYDAAVSKLAEAREAANYSDPLDANALALRGYIAKTLAQIAEARGVSGEHREYLREAERFFKHVVALDPENAGGWNGLGNIQAMLDEHDRAIQSYQRAIMLLPQYTAAHHDLAISFEAKIAADPQQSRAWREKALNAWQRAYELASMDPAFSEHDVVVIGRRIQWLKSQAGRPSLF